MTAPKNVAHLVKRNRNSKDTKTKTTKPIERKEELVVEKPKLNNIAETVSVLLHEIDTLSATDVKESVGVTLKEETSMGRGNVEWLEEQVANLTAEAETLRAEFSVLKTEYDKMYDDMQQLTENGSFPEQTTSNLQPVVVNLFRELQHNLITMGVNQQTGRPNFVINPVGFLNRMIAFFPFLELEKKF